MRYEAPVGERQAQAAGPRPSRLTQRPSAPSPSLVTPTGGGGTYPKQVHHPSQ
ncbi:hypothetical protein BDV27DRAFT_164869 [Aspergillus caelatus]|uniref:Uncharacterized protein n=1 Tax=Aspergillus caelatus TaxID=61420 RepID=A0A5N6ZIM8_9EURO|nr:uncharacterized protein BDV27DRAFT_164869 [Aspergillus caelatus]KAE8357083.1 hypothetical protein BDV27DRAFT_164869 [Aspergillus caelatus]